MKANEFQIGDWVQWNFDVEPKHRQIFSIITEEDSDGNKEYYVDLGDGEIYKDLIPIPLTAEILEKNGFLPSFEMGHETLCLVGSEYSVYYRHDDTYLYVFKRDNDHGEGDFVESDYRSKRLKYVHELQHALRLCGLSDLADNFKI